ncbi:hypothetical protein KL905_003390 [Ogataea polymorpha]|uniref:GOLD domain-containing protein n=1 Tax=Ogataea polymorpha TaxID=460523 RepID=A0A9P8TFK0_9ASCO|nr:hypothetical protein KL937_002972 [Ogataea polymorpha]KAG7892275.1 hypothetical protein KL908_003227 [Ogataea polymorpha]KAG7920756.1 hypothetical protein KL905_003390 [Ogataea polymorpha]KAG7934819.1 hypothetical protein KL904_003151 [Ogataea polymorpha]KAH3677718.1 hypothetical protein OGATHE_000372 [Ogataea polymorpha]
MSGLLSGYLGFRRKKGTSFEYYQTITEKFCDVKPFRATNGIRRCHIIEPRSCHDSSAFSRVPMRWAMYLCLLLLFIGPVSALRFGVCIQPSAGNAIDLFRTVNDYQSRINAMNKLNNKERQLLTERFETAITNYISSNTCLRYYLKDHLEISMEGDKQLEMSNILISLDIHINEPIDAKIQQLNLNVIDRHGNTLRRKNNLQDQNIQMVVDFPLYDHRNDYKVEYLDLCFENIKIDQSWKSSPKDIEAYTTLKFGVPEILKTYEENSKELLTVKSKLFKIENEVDQIITQIRQMLSDESKLRNLNEAILSNFSLFGILIVLILMLSGGVQLWWLINCMKKKSLL